MPTGLIGLSILNNHPKWWRSVSLVHHARHEAGGGHDPRYCADDVVKRIALLVEIPWQAIEPVIRHVRLTHIWAIRTAVGEIPVETDGDPQSANQIRTAKIERSSTPKPPPGEHVTVINAEGHDHGDENRDKAPLEEAAWMVEWE